MDLTVHEERYRPFSVYHSDVNQRAMGTYSISAEPASATRFNSWLNVLALFQALRGHCPEQNLRGSTLELVDI
jgi:hypothetical protein